MAKVQQKVYLITEQQRNALINYLQSRPYREVAPGIQFLTSAPTAVLNMDVPDEVQSDRPSESAPKSASKMDGVTEVFQAQSVTTEELIPV